MVIQGCTSAYAIWMQLKQESLDSGQEKGIIAYKNVNVRLTKLVKLGYIAEIAPHTYTQHGRRDYKVTMKGMEQLIPYIMTQPEEVQNIIQYMDKFGLDKKGFGSLIFERIESSIEVISKYIPEVPDIITDHTLLHKIDSKIHYQIEQALKRHGYDETTGTFNISDKSSSGKKKKPTLEK